MRHCIPLSRLLLRCFVLLGGQGPRAGTAWTNHTDLSKLVSIAQLVQGLERQATCSTSVGGFLANEFVAHCDTLNPIVFPGNTENILNILYKIAKSKAKTSAHAATKDAGATPCGTCATLDILRSCTITPTKCI